MPDDAVLARPIVATLRWLRCTDLGIAASSPYPGPLRADLGVFLSACLLRIRRLDMNFLDKLSLLHNTQDGVLQMAGRSSEQAS